MPSNAGNQPPKGRLHERVKMGSSGQPQQPAGRRPGSGRPGAGRPGTRRLGRAEDGEQEERPRRLPPKQKSPVPLIAGIGGGVLFLIIIIAVASSGSPPRKLKRKPIPVAPPVVEKHVDKQDTGPITFNCVNSDKHPDQERMWRNCPKCGGRAPFYWDYDQNKFRCYECDALFAKTDIKCEDCGKTPPPQRVFIKHRPQ